MFKKTNMDKFNQAYNKIISQSKKNVISERIVDGTEDENSIQQKVAQKIHDALVKAGMIAQDDWDDAENWINEFMSDQEQAPINSQEEAYEKVLNMPNERIVYLTTKMF